MGFVKPASAEEKRDLGRVRVSFMASGGRAYNSSEQKLLFWDDGESGGV